MSLLRASSRLNTDTGRYTPILAVTANAMSEHVAASKQAGADAHLAKPIVPNLLIEAISAAVSRPEEETTGTATAFG